MEKQKKQDSIISHDLVQTTINYLAEKPYREVHQLLHAFVNLKPVETGTGIEDMFRKQPELVTKDTNNGR